MHDANSGCSRGRRGAAGISPAAGEDDSLVGKIVAERYKVRDVIGVGTTGTVFEVEHVTFARPAAMKVLRPRFADAEVVSRVFHGEARASWSVTHPCLCEVFDIGTLPDGAPFFVMERLDGETLAARIARERLSLAAAVDLLMQLLSAITVVHGRDLLFRDLRPRNLYLANRRGCRPLLKILDFGLARLAPLDRIRQAWEARGGSADGADGIGPTAIPFYLSPERARGEHAAEPASDLFVAATIFYEALAGERPFVSSSWSSLLGQISHGKPAPLHERRPDISPELSAFVSRCLSASPRMRPASAKEMQEELRAAVEKTALPRPPSGSYERAAQAPTYEEDETETQRDAVKRKPFPDGIVIPRLNAGELEDEVSTAARTIDPALLSIEPPHVDEASAESAERTVPPPPFIDVEISFEESTDHDFDVQRHGIPTLSSPRSSAASEEEETATMELAPELRERVDQLMATKPTPVAVVPQAATKPPRRR